MKSRRAELAIDLFWVVFSAAYCYLALGYPPAGRLVPLTVGLVALAAGFFQLVGHFAPALYRFTHGDGDTDPDYGVVRQAEIRAGLWAAALLAGIVVIGALPAVFIFFVSYFAVNGRRWILGVVSAVVMTTIVWWLFGRLMSFELPQGFVEPLVTGLI